MSNVLGLFRFPVEFVIRLIPLAEEAMGSEAVHSGMGEDEVEISSRVGIL